uniref:Uncharacterized protein n=1 Tax=Nothoprocta perdicaria TaxID=30464 RepID=A0A8C6ZU49_NOTPE
PIKLKFLTVSVINQKLQKMVHDIKKNETGIINKFKKLKKKPPPSVPKRDYASGKTGLIEI